MPSKFDQQCQQVIKTLQFKNICYLVSNAAAYAIPIYRETKKNLPIWKYYRKTIGYQFGFYYAQKNKYMNECRLTEFCGANVWPLITMVVVLSVSPDIGPPGDFGFGRLSVPCAANSSAALTTSNTWTPIKSTVVCFYFLMCTLAFSLLSIRNH